MSLICVFDCETRDFWRRHRRKAFVTVGVLGSGYFLYKLYDAHRRKLAELERELADEREGERFIKAQLREMQSHHVFVSLVS